MKIPYRIGFGYDVHRLEQGYDLWLGGVKIPHEVGLEGHSDADVLLHAVCDSKILLRRVCELLDQEGYVIGNIDATIAAEAPKLNPHIPAMKQVMAEVMGLEVGAISIKATTSERLGFVGHREGMAAYATALIVSHE